MVYQIEKMDGAVSHCASPTPCAMLVRMFSGMSLHTPAHAEKIHRQIKRAIAEIESDPAARERYYRIVDATRKKREDAKKAWKIRLAQMEKEGIIDPVTKKRIRAAYATATA